MESDVLGVQKGIGLNLELLECDVRCFAVGEASTANRRVGLQHSSGEAGRLSFTSRVSGFRQMSDCISIRQLTKLSYSMSHVIHPTVIYLY